MQSERTIQFWDDYHERNVDKEWLMRGSSDLLESIYRSCAPSKDGRLRILEIGCGTSAMARDLWKHIEDAERNARTGRRVWIRSTDVSRLCVQSCYERDKNLPNVYGPDDLAAEGSGLEYVTLDVQLLPTPEESGQWDAVIDKACMDTFLFRSKSRGEKKQYPPIAQAALETIWSLITDYGVYILISPRPKLKPVRDFAGFSSVERREIRPEVKGLVVPRSDTKGGNRNRGEVCYMYVCHKNVGYVIGDPDPFRQALNIMPADDSTCQSCGVGFGAFREMEDPAAKGGRFWKRTWKNHCAHCKGRQSS
jgi:hypothetical protein